MEQLRERWVDQLRSRYGTDTWAPMRFELGNRDLRRWASEAGPALPPLPRPHRGPSGRPHGPAPRRQRRRNGSPGAADPAVVTFAGTGFAGIRPGAFLLLINDGSIGWCSMAHIYGSPGGYAVSTAGHCGKPGDVATAIGAVGNQLPVLLDFGNFSTSHDAGLGNDWALIPVDSQYQSLVTPTMAFWGGPIGMYTAQGEAVDPDLAENDPGVGVNPQPNLVQDMVHYGHGAGIGAGGTPRAGAAIAWTANHFMFSGAITPGDSGSGANTLTGDGVGDNREAAGIITHLWARRSGLRDSIG